MNYKFKTLQSVEPSEGQTFPTTKPVFRLNKATGELEDTGETVDLQEVINSCIDTALDRALDRLMPKVQQAEDLIELETMREDLDFAMEACNRAEDYREKFKLDDKLSVTDVFAYVAKQAEILDAKRKQAMAGQKESVENEKTKTVKTEE